MITYLNGKPVNNEPTLPVYGWWNHFHSLWRQLTDRPINKVVLSQQWRIVKHCMAANDTYACDGSAHDFTCWYIGEMLAERRRNRSTLDLINEKSFLQL